MLPILKNKIAEKLRDELAAELGNNVDDLVRSLIEDFAPPWLAQQQRFVSILGTNIAPAGEMHGKGSEEYFFKIRFLVRSPYNTRVNKSEDLDDLLLGLYQLERKTRRRIEAAAGIDIINECNAILLGQSLDRFVSLIRWRSCSAEPVLLPSDYFGSEPILEDLSSDVAELNSFRPVTNQYEGVAIDSYYAGVRAYQET